MDAAKWDKNAGEYQKVFQSGMNEYNRRLMDFLLDGGMLRPGCRVLDVGCGVGKYGTYFAALGCDVTLTDISAQMLRRAEENMSRFPGSGWRTLHCDFNTLSPAEPAFAEGFELSISTMCPAIHDLETVKKLSSMTEGFCFITNFAEWQQPLRDRFYAAMGCEPAGAMGKRDEPEALHEAVRQAGYEPKTLLVPYNWQDDRSPVEAAEYLIKRHGAMDETDPELMKRAVAAAESLCNGRGIFEDAVSTTVEWLWWDTRKER